MARAKADGYRLEEPIYHGMSGELEGGAFDLSRGGQTTDSSVGSVGLSAAHDPGLAEHFANRAGSDGANIIPGFYRAERVANLATDDSMLNHEVAGAILDAWDSGYDALRASYQVSPRGKKGETFVLLKDPAQFRSVMAKFDPAKRNSRDILADLGAWLPR